MVQTRQKKELVTKTIKKKPSSADKWYKNKPMIEFLKSHSTFLEGLLMFYRNAKNFTYKDSLELGLVALANMYHIPRQRFTPPSVYLFFDSERSELELNLLMKYGPVRRQKDLELLGQHNITKECSINLLENNELFDWGYIGVYSCEDPDDIRKNGQQRALEYVERYVEKRNETMIRMRDIRKKHKGKFILRSQLDYEIVLYMSNYFELMFKFLEPDELQSDEEQYISYYEHWLNTNLEEVKTRIERWKDFINARKKWKMNDKWEVVNNELDLNNQRFKYFIHETNAMDLAGNFGTLDKRDMLKKFYKLWISGVAVKNLTFKTVLTYEKFKAETNVRSIVLNVLHRSKRLSKRNFERVLRTFYNQEVINAKTLPEEVKFTGDQNLNHYFLATRLHEANEYEEFDEEQEKEFLSECEKERATSRHQQEEKTVERIQEWLSGADSSSLDKRIEELVNQVLGEPNEMVPSSSVSETEYRDSSSSEEIELVEYGNMGLVPAGYYPSDVSSEHNNTRTSEMNHSPVKAVNELEGMTLEELNQAISVFQEPLSSLLPSPTCHYPLPDTEAACTSSTLPNTEAPIQVQDINTSTQTASPQSTKTSSGSDVTLSENEGTIIHKPAMRRRSLRFSNVQRLVDDILDVDPDEPIGNSLDSSTPLRKPMPVTKSQRRMSISDGNSLASSTPLRKPIPVTESQRRMSISEMQCHFRKFRSIHLPVLQKAVEKQINATSPRPVTQSQGKTTSPRPMTRSQVRYLTAEETLERATFNGMSPSIR